MMDPELLVGTLSNVLISSSMFILAALGFAFIFNMMGVLNLAHGAIYMIGGYVTYQFAVAFGLNPWAAILISAVVFALFGIFLEKYFFRPFIDHFDFAVVACVAISVILQQAVNIMVGTKIMSIPSLAEGIFKAGLVSVSYERITIFVIGGILTGIVIWFVWKTKMGQQMQAVTQNREAASLQGINVNRVYAIACAVGSGLAAVAGSLMGAFTNLNPFMGDAMLLKVIMLVILAGAGSIGGVVIGGVILGAMNAVLPLLLSGEVAEVIYVAVIVVLLLFRPQGLFGHEFTIK
jgi:branched-chain amino acid transport system permease protein